jgi:hypothetical protein
MQNRESTRMNANEPIVLANRSRSIFFTFVSSRAFAVDAVFKFGKWSFCGEKKSFWSNARDIAFPLQLRGSTHSRSRLQFVQIVSLVET